LAVQGIRFKILYNFRVKHILLKKYILKNPLKMVEMY